jgi:hypothetical protein
VVIAADHFLEFAQAGAHAFNLTPDFRGICSWIRGEAFKICK